MDAITQRLAEGIEALAAREDTRVTKQTLQGYVDSGAWG